MKKFYASALVLFCILSNLNAQSPSLLKDIIPGSVGGFSTAGQYGYYYHPFTIVWQHNGEIFFTANNSALNPGGSYTNDVELWKSDGTAGGTVMVKDIYPGSTYGSDPQDFIDINGTLYFTAYNPTSGRELWKTDGTTAGTEMVKDIVSGSVGGFTTAGQYGYYNLTFNVVWKSGNYFFFTANDAPMNPGGSYTNNIELWVSDGTTNGTYMVKDIYPGSTYGSDPADFTLINGILYFTAYNNNLGRELWRTDGTFNGTILLKEIANGIAGGFSTAGQYGYYNYPFSVVWQSGNYFFFTANDAPMNPGGSYTNNIELWVSDGTANGTYMVKDIYPGSTYGSDPADFTLINGILYFTAYNNNLGRELWRTDGTYNGTILLKEIANGIAGGFSTAGQYGYYNYPFSVVWQSGNYFFFTANDAPMNPGGSYTNNIELWVSDGTANGTYMVKDIYPGSTYGSEPTDFTLINGILYFTAYNNNLGRELWKTDGTYNGTVLVKEIANGIAGGFSTAGQYGYYNYAFNVVWQTGNTFYFTANDSPLNPGGSYTNNIELWKSDGTAGGTMMVKDIYPGNTEGSEPQDFTGINGTLYFTAYNNTSGRELWKTDGSTSGTVIVKEIASGNKGGFSTAGQYGYYTMPFYSPFSVGGYFYFVANDNPMNPGGSYTNNEELWKSDGTDAGTTKVMEIYPGNTSGCDAQYFTLALNKVFFTANDNAHGNELWTIDNATPTGVNDITSTASLKLYPNPTSDHINMMLTTTEASTDKLTITLADLHGRILKTQSETIAGGLLINTIDVSNLPSGVYVLSVIGEKIGEVRRVVRN